MKMVYLTLGTTGLTPRELLVRAESSTVFSASWKPPMNFDHTKEHKYKTSWVGPTGMPHTFFTSKTHIRVDGFGVYGGYDFLLTVCFTYMPADEQASDCIYGQILMPEGIPTQGPYLKEYTRRWGKRNEFELTWEPLSKEHSMGKIIKYNIYAQKFFADYRSPVEKIEVPGGDNSNAAIHLKKGSYKVWITGVTSKGEGPKSDELTIYTEDYHHETNMLQVQTEWSKTQQDQATISWKLRIKATETAYKILYVPIPYNDYWREVTDTQVDGRISSIKINNLDPKLKYRFTVLCLREVERYPRDDIIDGQSSNAYLMPRGVAQSTNSSRLDVPAPKNLRCTSDKEQEIKLTWDTVPSAPNTKVVLGYRVHLLEEIKGSMGSFETRQSSLVLTNLTKGFWYGVQLTAYGQHQGRYLKSEFLSCRTKTKAPSKPRDVEYDFIYDNLDDTSYLRLRWKPPLFTGGSVFSYQIVHETDEAIETLVNFPFPVYERNVILNRQDDEYIHYEGIWTQQTRKLSLKQIFTIVAINDYGRGEAYTNTTHGVFYSKLHKADKPTSNQSPSQKPFLEEDNRMGILAGLSISLFFLLLFIVICVVKEPCKKINTGLPHHTASSNTGGDFEYQQRLLVNHSSNQSNGTTTSEENSDESRLQRNKKNNGWKFFQKFHRPKLPGRRSYGKKDFSDSGIRVSYSSGSSASRIGNLQQNNCPPRCASTCSVLESYNDRRIPTEDARISFLPPSSRLF
eukprot:TCONS_00069235-protein